MRPQSRTEHISKIMRRKCGALDWPLRISIKKSIFEGKKKLSLCDNHSMPKTTEENPYHTQKQNDLTTKKNEFFPQKKGFLDKNCRPWLLEQKE